METLCDYKLFIVEMATKEWNDIIEGVRNVHPELKFRSDEEVETFLKDSTVAFLLHGYVDFADEHKQHFEQSGT